MLFSLYPSLLGIERQKKLEKFAILTRKPRSYARILIYRTWPIRSPVRGRTGFKIEGFASKFPSSPPPPPSFHLFALAPIFARPECKKLTRAARISFASYGNACYAGYPATVMTSSSHSTLHVTELEISVVSSQLIDFPEQKEIDVSLS